MEIKLATPLSEVPSPPETLPTLPPERVAGGLFAPGNQIAPGGDSPLDDAVIEAEAEDISRRILRDGGHVRSMESLAKEVGWSGARLKRFLSNPKFKSIYAKVTEEFYGSIDQHIKDERLDSLTRVGAINARGYTLLGEIMDVVGKHTKDVMGGGSMPRATLIKAGVDAVAEARQAATMLHNRGRDESSRGTTNIFVTGKHASLIQTTMKEAGIDISDVLNGYIDAEVVDEKTD